MLCGFEYNLTRGASSGSSCVTRSSVRRYSRSLSIQMAAIQFIEQRQLIALLGGRQMLIAQVRHELLRLHCAVLNMHALIDRRHVARRPKRRTQDRKTRTEHDEAPPDPANFPHT